MTRVPESEFRVLGLESHVLGSGFWGDGGDENFGPGSWFPVPGSWVLGPESWVLVSGYWVLGPWSKGLGPQFRVMDDDS